MGTREFTDLNTFFWHWFVGMYFLSSWDSVVHFQSDISRDFVLCCATQQKCICLISLHANSYSYWGTCMIIWLSSGLCGFALQTRHFRVHVHEPETPSRAVFKQEVAKKCHSAGTQKSATRRSYTLPKQIRLQLINHWREYFRTEKAYCEPWVNRRKVQPVKKFNDL